jgi:hypothetical protein
MMRKFAFLWAVLMILAFQVGPLTQAQAEVVGRLTQVEGRVDLLKGGQLPATPVKVDDGVQLGDVLRTKCLSKAQITFIDNSTLTISPESRVAIETYLFDSAKQKRSAVLQLFQGLAHVVVSKISEVVEPDFVIKTHTAVMGVRGTEFGIRLMPNSSTILNLEGVLQVGNIFPEVGLMFQRAFKLAYSFGPCGEGGRWVCLKNLQGTTVDRGLPPTMPYKISKEDWKGFLQQMVSGLNLSRRSDSIAGTTCQTGGGEGGAGTAMGTLTGITGTGGGQSVVNPALGPQGPPNLITTPVYTPPPLATQQVVAPSPPPPPPPTRPPGPPPAPSPLPGPPPAPR